MLARKIFKWFVRVFADFGLVLPLVVLCARKTQLIHPSAARNEPIIILALSPARFLGDLRALACSGTFTIYSMPEYWQYAALALHAYDSKLQRRFLTRFLHVYRRYIPFDVVVGTSVWYKQDIPWGAAAQRSGVPYVILHKECFKPEPVQTQAAVEKALKFGPFMGERLLVHNEPIARAFISKGYVSKDEVDVCGAMRMDDFVGRAKSSGVSCAAQRKRPLVTYFSFALGLGLDDRGVDPFPKDPRLGWYDLFCGSHLAFAQLALRRPDVDFIIKTKWLGQWTKLIEQVLQDGDVELDKLHNLNIQSSGDAHSLIFESLVVCSFASTTILEASLARKPVIIPHFGEVDKEGFRGRVKLFDSYSLFDVAETPNDFAQRIEERLNNPDVNPKLELAKRNLFERWVSPLNESALKRYIEILSNVGERGVTSQSDR